MENCVVREITYIDEYIELCEIASKSNHPNASNYDVDKMRKRWNKYLIFTKLTRGDEVISFAGIIDFGNNLVRVADRLYTKQEYRQNYMTKSIANPLKLKLHYNILYLIIQNGQLKEVMIVFFCTRQKKKKCYC